MQHDERIRISIHILRLLFRLLRNITIESVLVLIFIFYAFFFVVLFVKTTSRGGRGQTNNTIDQTTTSCGRGRSTTNQEWRGSVNEDNTTNTTRMSTKCNQGGRFIGSSKRRRR